VWRVALAALDDAFDGAPPLERLRLFDSVPTRDVAVVRQMAARGLHSPLAHGAGRYFDALGALGLARGRAAYEGQVALDWNLAADEAEKGTYPFDLAEEGGLVQADLRPLVRAAVADLLNEVTPGRVSARFHEAMADVAAALVRRAAAVHGPMPVVLTGGCFQNAWLAEGVVRRLQGDFDVRLHGEVPPGDGGIALGQALVADAVAGA
ncbi:MAG TPA: carbamoyltransferase HypF, partial [Vicinamibacteria bacterium]|nr:carbamoyltransferase HypF [Vicinamibacteria bacterium]